MSATGGASGALSAKAECGASGALSAKTPPRVARVARYPQCRVHTSLTSRSGVSGAWFVKSSRVRVTCTYGGNRNTRHSRHTRHALGGSR